MILYVFTNTAVFVVFNRYCCYSQHSTDLFLMTFYVPTKYADPHNDSIFQDPLSLHPFLPNSQRLQFEALCKQQGHTFEFLLGFSYALIQTDLIDQPLPGVISDLKSRSLEARLLHKQHGMSMFGNWHIVPPSAHSQMPSSARGYRAMIMKKTKILSFTRR